MDDRLGSQESADWLQEPIPSRKVACRIDLGLLYSLGRVARSTKSLEFQESYAEPA
jgi:hypothetical protein